jgi:hypothetical protein
MIRPSSSGRSYVARSRVLFLAAFLWLCSASILHAQALAPAPGSERAPKTTPPQIEQPSDRSIQQLHTTEEVVMQLSTINPDDVRNKIEESFDTVRGGKRACITLNIGEESMRPMRLRLTVEVLVEYEERPIGGILRITADLLPMFTGIYSSLRPLVSNDYAEAVDYLDVDEIANVVHERIQKLGEQYTLRNTHMYLQSYGSSVQ